MKKQILLAFPAVMVMMMVMALTSCGGKRSDETTVIVERKNSQLTDALRSRDYSTASSLADSMALYVDDLTPDEAVTVLMAFLEAHNINADNGRESDDLETLRKYVDVYDIATGNNPNDMRAAFSRARSINPELDFEKAAGDFRRLLAEYDAVQTYGEVSEPDKNKTDSTATTPADSVATASGSTLSVN